MPTVQCEIWGHRRPVVPKFLNKKQKGIIQNQATEKNRNESSEYIVK